MGISRFYSYFGPGGRWPEIWLTPVLGLLFLAVFIFCHDEGQIAHVLGEHAIVAVAAGLLPLVIAGLVQGVTRLGTSNWWIQLPVSGFTGCVAVGAFYLVCAAHYGAIFPPDHPVEPEGYGNMLALLGYEAANLGAIGGFAGVISSVATQVLARPTR